MTTLDNIKATAADNARLLQTISETEYAPSALQQSNSYIANLKAEIVQQEKFLKEARSSVKLEEAEHKKYANSHVKRMAYRFGGKKEKFEERASKEEQDWVYAVQREIECSKKLDTLNQNLADATKTKGELETTLNTYVQSQKELDSLYKSVFGGPTPDVPGEDMREDALNQALSTYDSAQTKLDKEKQVRGILEEAWKFMKAALIQIEEARSTQKADAFGFGGTFMEIHELNLLSQVQQNMAQVEMSLTHARMIEPSVGQLGPVIHAGQNLMGDVLFDNVFSDIDKYEKIKASQASIQKAQQTLKSIAEASTARLKTVTTEATYAKQRVDEARAELQRFRANAYEQIAGGGGGISNSTENVPAPEGPPPSYQP